MHGLTRLKLPIKINSAIPLLGLTVLLIGFTIIILKNQKILTPATPISVMNKCNIPDNVSKINCWNDAVEKTVKQNGIIAAIDLIAFLSEKDPQFAESCHDLMHLVGQKSYTLFLEHKFFGLTPKITMCSFGFYHGFMETMISKEKNYGQAGKFCEYITAQLNDDSPASLLGCYHGIGHGLVSSPDKNMHGDPEIIIQPALKICEKLSMTGNELNRCSSGVFMGTYELIVNHKNGMSINLENPFLLCELQPLTYRQPCYAQQYIILSRLTDFKIENLAKFVEKIKEDSYAKAVMQNSVANFTNRIQKQEFPQAIRSCQNLPSRLIDWCIRGLAQGLMEKYQKNNEYDEAIHLCQSDMLSNKNRLACYDLIQDQLTQLYPAAKLQEICVKINSALCKQ